jgi:hypothetical protein
MHKLKYLIKKFYFYFQIKAKIQNDMQKTVQILQFFE